MIGIKDVANLAGVSKSTVSIVLNGKLDSKYDLIIYPYENNYLFRENSLVSASTFHGALIANAGQKDLEFLSSIDVVTPIVLYNRIMDNLSSVYVDDEKIAQKAFELIKNQGYVSLVAAPHVFQGMKIRDTALIELLKKNKQPYDALLVDENRPEDGYQIACKIEFNRTKVIYTASDMIAVGILHYCYENGIRVPEDVQILAIGNGLSNIDEYLNPSLSTIEIPIEPMAFNCLFALDHLFYEPSVVHKEVLPAVKMRGSCLG